MKDLSNDPTTLVRQADELRQQGESKAADALECVHQSGLRLIAAKRLLPHGQFEPYLAQNWHDSLRKAQMYMQVAGGWSQIEQKRNTVADLSLRGAVRLVATPKPAQVTDASKPKPQQKPPQAATSASEADVTQWQRAIDEASQRAAQAESELQAATYVNESAERAAKEIVSRDAQIAALKAEVARLTEEVGRWKYKCKQLAGAKDEGNMPHTTYGTHEER